MLFSCTGNKKKLQTHNTNNDSAYIYSKNAADNAYSYDERLDFSNKALNSLESKNNDSLYAQMLYQKSWLQYVLGQYDSLKVSDSIINTDVALKDNYTILGLQNYLMAYYFDKVVQIPDSAFKRYNTSNFYYKKLKDSVWVGTILSNMGAIQKNQGDIFGSKETLTDAIPYIIAGKNEDNLASAYNNLATSHRKLYNYEEAVTYYSKAIALASVQKDISVYKNNLAATYIDLKDFKKAQSILEDAVKDSTVKGSDQARIQDNLAYAKWLSGKPVSAEDFLIPLALRKEIGEKRGLLASYTHLGEFYTNRNSQLAVRYLDTVIQISKAIEAPRAEQDALAFLMQLNPNSVQLRNRYIKLEDSLYQQELKVKTQFAKYKYDDEVKQEAILRLEKENAEAELEAIRERNYRYWLLGSLLILIPSTLVGIYAYQQRIKRLKTQNRADRLEASYATEATLSQRLHDDFGAGLHHLMLLVQSKAESEKVLDELDGLYQQSRDFSREIKAVDTGENFKEALLDMLNLYKPEDTRLLISGSKDISWQSLSNVTKITLYKVLRELFINMNKHSEASLVTLSFRQQTDALEVRYSDNGVGLTTAKGFEKNGLLITEKRMEAVGGTITFESDQGEGFKSVISIPNY